MSERGDWPADMTRDEWLAYWDSDVAWVEDDLSKVDLVADIKRAAQEIKELTRGDRHG